MKGILIAALVFILAALGAAQDQKRIDAIWAAVDNRMSMQIDVWFEDGEFPMTIQLLRMENDLFPKDYDVATNLGWMQENVEQWDAALVTYQRFKLSNPTDPDARLPEADYWFRKRQWAKVIPLLENRVPDKAHANMYRILAHAYERTGKLQESEKTWKRYLAMAPKDLAAKKNLERVEKKIREQ